MSQKRADDIRRDMIAVRSEIGEDVSEVVESARQMADWKSYVRRYPWVCVGIAAAVGFVAVPRKPQLVSPDASELLKLAKRHKLVVETKPQAQTKKGLTGTLLSVGSSLALRAAMSYIGGQAGKFVGNSAAEANETSEMSRTP